MNAAKTSSSPRHIFHHWGPMPVHTNASLRRGGDGAAGGDLPAVGKGLKLFSRIGDAVCDHGVAMVQMRASLAERVTQIRQRDVGVSGQMLGQLTGRRDQCFVATRRDRQRSASGGGRAGGAHRGGRGGGADRGRRLGEHHVGVGAAEAERVHPGYASLAVGKRPTRSQGRRSSGPRETRVGSESSDADWPGCIRA